MRGKRAAADVEKREAKKFHEKRDNDIWRDARCMKTERRDDGSVRVHVLSESLASKTSTDPCATAQSMYDDLCISTSGIVRGAGQVQSRTLFLPPSIPPLSLSLSSILELC